jgi:hypothetical protein
MLRQGMWLGDNDVSRTPLFVVWIALEVGWVPRARLRIKFGSLVGEESEVPRVGHVSRHGNDDAPRPSTFRAGVCRRRYVSFGPMLPILGSWGCSPFVLSLAMTTLDRFMCGSTVMWVTCAPYVRFKPDFLKKTRSIFFLIERPCSYHYIKKKVVLRTTKCMHLKVWIKNEET